jgi:hypothetical protein
MYELTKNEELVLLSVWKLKDNASGVTIRERFDTYLSTHQGSIKTFKLEAKNAKELFA